MVNARSLTLVDIPLQAYRTRLYWQGDNGFTNAACRIHSLWSFDIAGLFIWKRPSLRYCLLHVVGGPRYYFLNGSILGAASHRMAVVCDNALTSAAVLAAVTMNHWWKFMFLIRCLRWSYSREQYLFFRWKPPLWFTNQWGLTSGKTLS